MKLIRSLYRLGQVESPFVTGRYSSTLPGVGGSSSAPTQSRLRVTPFFVNEATTFDRIGCLVSTGAASSTLRWAVYGDTAGLPGTLLLDTGAVGDGTVSATFTQATINLQLVPGKYWVGAVAQGGNPILGCVTGSVAPGMTYGATADIVANITPLGLFMDSVTGAIPATYVPNSSAVSTAPMIFVRKA